MTKNKVQTMFEAKNYIKTFSLQNEECEPVLTKSERNYKNKHLIVYRKSDKDNPGSSIRNVKNLVTFKFNLKEIDNKKEKIDLFIEKNILSVLTNKTSNILNLYGDSELVAIVTIELNKKDGGDRSFTIITNNNSEEINKNIYSRIKGVSTVKHITIKT